MERDPMMLLKATSAPAQEPGYDYAADLAAYPAVNGVVDTSPYAPMVYADVPVPDGYPQSVCHPSVTDTGMGGFGGYRWWMANTPYPPDPLEDPIVLASNDRITWVEPATGVNPLATNMRTGEFPNAYNSDPEIVYDPATQTLYCYWRWVGDVSTTRYYGRSSTDGVTWTPMQEVEVAGRYLSPAVVRVNDGFWVMYTMSPAVRMRATSPLGPFRAAEETNLRNTRHGDVIFHDGLWWALGTSSGGGTPAYASISRDGVTWFGPAEVPITGGWTTAHYRPTILPSNSEGYIDVWSGVLGGRYLYDTGYTRVPKSVWLNLLD